MKEEEIKKILETATLPDIELQSHQRRLKMALLAAASLKQQEKAVKKTAKPERKGEIITMLKNFLVSPQPVWKTGLVSILAIALILGLSLTLPFTPESAYAQAEEIVQNSPEIHAALGEVTEVTVINIADGTVIAQGEAGTVSARVDLNTNKVTEVAVFTVDDQMAIDIAKADPRVQELLASGATIGDVASMCVSGQTGNVLTGVTEFFTETQVMVTIDGNDCSYIAYIDLEGGKVDKILKAEASAEPPPDGTEAFSIPDSAAGEAQ